uniref:Uncharacterized protein n=1 Tax=Arundo donax TaxID=35708 RepID=A0A0A9H4L3_ARUDO
MVYWHHLCIHLIHIHNPYLHGRTPTNQT